MLECIAAKHQLGAGLMDVASCFYTRNIATEEAYSIPFTQTVAEGSTGVFISWIEISVGIVH